MSRYYWAGASLALLWTVAGCRMCAGPDDYTSPAIREGMPQLGFLERHNSVLSPGTYTVSPRPDEDEETAVPVQDDTPREEMRPEPPARPMPRTQPRGTMTSRPRSTR